jgi:hypothetical protein
MKTWKICVPIFLALALMVSSTIGANAYSLLQKGSQAVMLIGISNSSGVVLLKNFQKVMPNGTLQSANFPRNTVFIATHIIWSFTATNSGLTGAAELRAGPYYSDKVTLSNGGTGDVDNISTGIVFGDMPDDCSARVVNVADESTIPGYLGVRVVGYLAAAQ